MGHPNMGPTWDPPMPDFQYDFHVSFNSSCRNHSTLNEHMNLNTKITF